jgi:hypothetical protein
LQLMLLLDIYIRRGAAEAPGHARPAAQRSKPLHSPAVYMSVRSSTEHSKDLSTISSKYCSGYVGEAAPLLAL